MYGILALVVDSHVVKRAEDYAGSPSKLPSVLNACRRGLLRVTDRPITTSWFDLRYVRLLCGRGGIASMGVVAVEIHPSSCEGLTWPHLTGEVVIRNLV